MKVFEQIEKLRQLEKSGVLPFSRTPEGLEMKEIEVNIKNSTTSLLVKLKEKLPSRIWKDLLMALDSVKSEYHD